MRWIKHVTNSIDDPKLARVRAEFGNEGYALYWIIVEVIARHFTKKTPYESITFPRKIWQNYCGISPKKLRNFVEFAQNEGLLWARYDGDKVTIGVPNLLKYGDDYVKKGLREVDCVEGDVYGQSTDLVRVSSSTSTSTSPMGNTTYLDSTTWAEYETGGS